MNGQDLQEKRKSLGLTQEKFARALGVTLSTVARWEADRDKEIRNGTMLGLAIEGLAARSTSNQSDSLTPPTPEVVKTKPARSTKKK